MKMIVITYDGQQIPDSVLNEAIKSLERFMVSGVAITNQYNEKDLISMGINATVKNFSSSANDELKQACTYFTHRFNGLFTDQVQLVLGMIEVSSTKEGDLLRNAIDIIDKYKKCEEAILVHGIPKSVLKTIVSFKKNRDV